MNEEFRISSRTDPKLPVITRSLLVDDLSKLGIAPGDTIMFHVSVKSIGWVVGGPDTVIQALLDVVGDEGTIMMYTGWEDSPYKLLKWPAEKAAAYLAECPAYDRLRSRAYRKWSILTEYLRTWPGSSRSEHPDGSFTALGKNATKITADHALQYGYGDQSPLSKLCKLKGKVLLLGSPLTDITLIHHAEHKAQLENKRIVKYKMPILQNGERTWIDMEEFDTSNSIIAELDDIEYFAEIANKFLTLHSTATVPNTEKLAVSGRVGAAQSYLFAADHLCEFAKSWLEDYGRS